jgi:lipopolysaccharide cholinephosphotransferase
MKRIETDELRALQLKVLEVFHNYCIDNGLKYSLACGTLIGAIRHNGYIPWDDDIDVFMMRDDYDRFIKRFPLVYMDSYRLMSFERNKNWCRAYANLYDDRTIKRENKTSDEDIVGINIDVFPIDNVPDGKFMWKLYDSFRRLLIYITTAKYIKVKDHSLFKKTVIVLLKVLFFPFSPYFFTRLVDSYAKLFNKKQTKRVFENVCGIIQKRPFDRNDFSETILYKFESYEFYIMEGYDDYLVNGYGDYMKLPPENKRISHHTSIYYWK